MTGVRDVVTVYAPAGPGGGAAMAWAAARAERHGWRVDAVAARDDPPVSLVAGVVATVQGFLSSVLGCSGDLPGRLAAASAGARLLVVPAGVPDLQRVVDGAYCPTVVVPLAGPASPGAPVVVGCPLWDADDVLAEAFDEADIMGVPLVVVRADRPAWSFLPQGPGSGIDDARGRGEDAVSAWAFVHPAVWVRLDPETHGVARALEERARTAELVVLGRSSRGRFLAAASASPVGSLLRRSRCPVMVVPPVGPPHRTWLPRGRHGPPRPGPDDAG
jgi:nucleotide-binding universal stress UspA family protein